ncbi:protein enhanced disease resistance 4 [Tanacetum coccineum]|uniref:Protein enhanced disease resistance 4 n=1 Tax=Tanacetum coccineum TaxID=301880 RepID=A0ABQ4XNC8_9ASTR
MTSTMNTKVRLVRCPKCRNVLPEPPDVLVYECGGCGAKLQAKKPRNSAADTTSQRPDDDNSGKQKMEQGSNDQEASSSSNQPPLVNSISKPDLKSDHNDLHCSTEDQDAAENEESSTIGSPSGRVSEYLFGKQKKMHQLSDNRNDPRSSTELSGHEDPESSPEAAAHNRIVQEQKQENDHYQEKVEKQENVIVNATSVEYEHAVGKQKMEELSDDPETDSSSNKKLLANSMNELDRNEDYNEDPESSPESTVHSRLDHHDQEFVSCRNGGEFEESSEELTSGSSSELNEIKRRSRESISKKKIIRDSESGSKSSFKNLIAEKLLDTRQKKVVDMDEDDILSDDESADLNHRRRRFDRVSSTETLANTQFGGTSNYYGYEGSTSSFDGNESQFTRRNRIGFKGDEHVDSGNVNRFKRRNRLPDARPVYGLKGFHANARHSSPMIPENPKLERIELLKMVRELQDQLDRTNISNSQQLPSYYNHALNNPGRYGHRMAFSGETTAVNRRHEGSSCYQCYPQDRHFSAQLPQQHAYCNGPHYGPNTYSRYSGHSSPQHPSESEFSAPVRNDMTKKKRFVRPIAGGSPWITCYRCSELLQLPQSFLVFKKRSHALRCGACLKVLNFTLTDGTHVSRYYPEETIAAPPSSEVEDYDKSTGSRAYPVSCSDRSFQKSCSTETDKKSSREFSEERRKATMSRDPSASTRPSSSKTSGRGNTTSEILLTLRPTHQGIASAAQVPHPGIRVICNMTKNKSPSD